MSRHVFSLEEWPIRSISCCHEQLTTSINTKLPTMANKEALALILNICAKTVEHGDFKPGDNGFQYVLDYLDGMRPFGTRSTLIEKLKSEWYTRARS